MVSLGGRTGRCHRANNLGLMYADSQGVAQDNEAAFYWLIISAMNGYEGGQQTIEKVKRHLTPDQIEAVHGKIRSDLRSAEFNSKTSERNATNDAWDLEEALNAHSNGDFERAFSLFEKGAELGNDIAQAA